MAHSCPDCGMQCYCGGDIDDCCFDDTPEQNACAHCDEADLLDEEDDMMEEAE